MTTLWPIPDAARQELENGNAVKLTQPEDGGAVVIAFADDYEKARECEWEPEEGWDHYKTDESDRVTDWEWEGDNS